MKAPTRSFLSLTFGIVLVASTMGVMFIPSLKSPHSWLRAITVVTFLTFGYDKVIAGKNRTRVPESVLLSLVFLGGTVGALAGMSIFRHKTVKSAFRRRFWGVVAVQVIVIAGYYYWIERIGVGY